MKLRNYFLIATVGTAATGFATSASAQGATCGTYAAGAIVQPAQGTATGPSSTACGPLASATGTSSTAVGDRAFASGNFASAFGDFSAATGFQSTAIGDVASALSTNATAVGRNANVSAAATNGTALGSESTSSGVNSTAVGWRTTASGQSSTALGDRAVASGTFSTALGDFAAATGFQSTAVGDVASALATNSTALGRNANVTAAGTNGTAIGAGATVSHANSTAIGAGATSTAANQVTLGGAGSTVRLGGYGAGILQTDANGTISTNTSLLSGLSTIQGQISSLQSDTATLFDLSDRNRRDIRQANEGIAMALAMESPDLPDDARFAVSGGLGYFQHQAGGTAAVAARIGPMSSFSAGLGVGFDTGTLGARLGFQHAWK